MLGYILFNAIFTGTTEAQIKLRRSSVAGVSAVIATDKKGKAIHHLSL